jgi:hypothetical protein
MRLADPAFGWLRGLDSNQDNQIQSLVCCQLHHPGVALKSLAETPGWAQGFHLRAATMVDGESRSFDRSDRTVEEILLVLDCSGTVATGGKLEKETRGGAANLNGTEIEAAVPRSLIVARSAAARSVPGVANRVRGIGCRMRKAPLLVLPEDAVPDVWPKFLEEVRDSIHTDLCCPLIGCLAQSPLRSRVVKI